MPTVSAAGHPLCGHAYSSSCTWWCSWRQFVYLVAVLLLVLGLLVLIIGPSAIWQNMNGDAGIHLNDPTPTATR